MEGGAMHITKVLVPVDFSPPSTVAVNHAVLLARRFRARLTLLHVVEPSTALMYTFPTETESAEKQRCERAERMLAAMLSPEDQDDLDLDIVVTVGDISSEIAAAVREQHADFVVMGTHGRGLVGRWLIGSVTQSLLRKINVPILTVCHATRPLSFKRILFATDFSEASSEGLDFAMDLGVTLNAEVVVAHVIDKRPLVTYETPEVAAVFDAEQTRFTNEARSAFAQIEAEGRSRKVKVETILGEGIPADAIARIADENTVDFIVLAVSRKGRMDRILLGTTAEKVIRDANVPVLSIPVRPAAERSEHEIDEVSNAGTQNHPARP
jgi:nucleotide-binding universal stress UspA family protein